MCPPPRPHRYPRPRIVVSRCITFDPVRYDGSIILDMLVDRMKPFVDFIPVCPEVGIGLGVPRDPIRIVRTDAGDRLVQPATGRDLTEEMERFAREFLGRLPPVDGFILKERSPSSAKTGAKVFPDAVSATPVARGPGTFGRAVLARFGRLPVEGEGRLRDAGVRDHFLTAVFTLARFREARDAGQVRALARFHEENRLLLMAASGRALRTMDRLVANRDVTPPEEAFTQYRDLLLAALRRPSSVSAKSRVLALVEDCFMDRVPGREKRRFHASLRRYRGGLTTSGEPKRLVLAWFTRYSVQPPEDPGFGELPLGDQTFFSPYPEELDIREGEPLERRKDNRQGSGRVQRR